MTLKDQSSSNRQFESFSELDPSGPWAALVEEAKEPVRGENTHKPGRHEGRCPGQRVAQMARRVAAHLHVMAQVVQMSSPLVLH